MGNFTQVQKTSGADQLGQQLVATFQTGEDDYGTAARFCSRACSIAGENPAYAFISIPCKEFPADETGPSIALKQNGPAGDLKLNSRCFVSYRDGQGASQQLLVGTVVRFSHNLEEDSLIAEVFDDKWILSKYTVFGRMVYDPEAGLYYYDASTPCCFNRMGYPDCIDSPFGPVFAPYFRFGWRANTVSDYGEPSAGGAQTRARSWTVADAILYLRNQYSAQAMRANSQVDYGSVKLPPTILWDSNAGIFAGSDRTLKDVDINNKNLKLSLQILARKAGAIDVGVMPAGGFNSAIKFYNMNPARGTGSRLFTPDYTVTSISDLMNAGDIVHSGYVTESFIDGFHDTCICGDPTAIERFCTTLVTDTAFVVNGLPTLEGAWGLDSHAQYIQYISNGGSAQESWQAANLIFPDVYTAYRIGRGSPVFNGTKWANTSLGCRYPRIKPSQLTAFNNSDSNPRNWQSREIVVEYHLSPREQDDLGMGDPTWLPCHRYDNLTLSPDGTIIYLSALRDAGQTWYLDYRKDHFLDDCPDGQYQANKITFRDIRLNLAIESDWLITGRNKTDYNNISSRLDMNGPKYTYLSVSTPMDYVDYERSGASRPNGESNVVEPYKTQYYPPRETVGNELFSDRQDANTGRLPTHAEARQRDVARIDYSGQLKIARINPALIAGLPITLEGANAIPVFGVIKSVVWDSNDQMTIVEFGPPDSAVIYDSPSHVYNSPSPMGSGSMDSTTTKTGSGGGGRTQTPPTDTGGASSLQGSNSTGGKSQTQTDDYADNSSGLGGSDKAKQTQGQTSNEESQAGKQEIIDGEKVNEGTSSSFAFDNASNGSKAPKEKVGNAAKGQAAKQQRQDSKAQRDGRNANAGFGGFLGKPNSGTINGQSDIMNSFLGKNNSGTINGQGSIDKAQNGMFDTNKSREYDNKNYKQTPRDGDAFGAIANATGKQGQKAPTSPTPATQAASPAKASGTLANAQNGPDIPNISGLGNQMDKNLAKAGFGSGGKPQAASPANSEKDKRAEMAKRKALDTAVE